VKSHWSGPSHLVLLFRVRFIIGDADYNDRAQGVPQDLTRSAANQDFTHDGVPVGTEDDRWSLALRRNSYDRLADREVIDDGKAGRTEPNGAGAFGDLFSKALRSLQNHLLWIERAPDLE
jgi:hypothetical protein